MAMTVLILMISLSFPLSAGDAVGKKTQNGGREKDQTDHQISNWGSAHSDGPW